MKPYMTIETKADFDKMFKEIYYSGFEEGVASARAKILADILEGFTVEERLSADCIRRQRSIHKFNQANNTEVRQQTSLP